MRQSQAGAEYLIYGINPVQEILRSDRKVLAVYIQKHAEKNPGRIEELARQKHAPVRFVDKDFFEGRFEKGHQGVAASVTPKKTLDIDDMIETAFAGNSAPLFLVLDCIEDPRNFGAILRVADAAGVDGVVFQSRRAAGISPVVYKASAGAVEYVNLSEVVNIKHAIAKMKEHDVVIAGAESDAEKGLWDTDLRWPVAIVMGSEGEGLRQTVRGMCDVMVSLPMKGMVNSLNVSVATGVLAYEVLRQRAR
jgi:23S rRNA (guanosine2251-2'-O)-methyltransferase